MSLSWCFLLLLASEMGDGMDRSSGRDRDPCSWFLIFTYKFHHKLPATPLNFLWLLPANGLNLFRCQTTSNPYWHDLNSCMRVTVPDMVGDRHTVALIPRSEWHQPKDNFSIIFIRQLTGSYCSIISAKRKAVLMRLERFVLLNCHKFWCWNYGNILASFTQILYFSSHQHQ